MSRAAGEAAVGAPRIGSSARRVTGCLAGGASRTSRRGPHPAVSVRWGRPGEASGRPGRARQPGPARDSGAANRPRALAADRPLAGRGGRSGAIHAGASAPRPGGHQGHAIPAPAQGPGGRNRTTPRGDRALGLPEVTHAVNLAELGKVAEEPGVHGIEAGVSRFYGAIGSCPPGPCPLHGDSSPLTVGGPPGPRESTLGAASTPENPRVLRAACQALGATLQALARYHPG